MIETLTPPTEQSPTRHETRMGSSSGPADGVKSETVMHWLQSTMGLLHSAIGSCEFLARAAEALVDLIGLDSGRVMLIEADEWRIASAHTRLGRSKILDLKPSRRVLSALHNDKCTIWQVPTLDVSNIASLRDIDAVVAAPIFGRAGEVIGALYGDRVHSPISDPTPPLTRLDALLVETLATGVATGLSRLEHERDALTSRVRFEQFFTPALARHLRAQPDLLQGRDTEVSVLICDICGFSRISEKLGPAETMAWVSDVMQALSECVLEHQGVVVDYVGDQLLAMWGAPQEQPDHAALACSCATDMMSRLPNLDQKWSTLVKEPLRLGIGINTGIARVGNVGSQCKFKYGPLGNTVNLASRVQGATRYLGVDLLITAETRNQLPAGVQTRRLCRAGVANITEPVDLFELLTPDSATTTELQERYEQALNLFEQNQLRESCQILAGLLTDYANDGPSYLLMSRAVCALVNGLCVHDPIWRVPGK